MVSLVYLNRRPSPSFKQERLRITVSIALLIIVCIIAMGYASFMGSL